MNAEPRRPPRAGPLRAAALRFELVAVFGVLPGALWGLIESGVRVPVLPSLALVAALAFALLWRDPTFDRRSLIRWGRAGPELLRVLGLFALGGGGLVAYTLLVEPELWLRFPRERTELWAAVMVFYPLVSVVPQEVLWRAFLFHRYAPVLPGRLARALVSAAAFGWVHVLFGNALAVLLSGAGGALFAWTWDRTRSLPIVAIEHASYGCLLFTIGLGRYFYSG